MSLVRLLSCGAVALLQSCDLGQGGCENRPLASQASPDGAWVAAVFSRECGATTGFNVQVSVLPAGETPRDGGNALIMDPPGEYDASLTPEWRPDGVLVLTIPEGAKVFRREARVGETTIVYRGPGAAGPKD